MERVLGVIRLSVVTDETTSPERQRLSIENSARARGAEVVAWAVDLDVSASNVRPADRPELGKYIADPVGFDTVIFWRVDRLCRKVGDFADMIKWAEEYGKNLVSATESFDLSSPLGKAVAYIVAVFAELEAATIRERVLGAHNQLRKTGRWPGGRHPYGYMPEKRPDGSYLVPNPETKPVLDEIVDRVIDGEPLTAIARDLNTRAVPSPWGPRTKQTAESPRAGWSPQGIRRMCESESLLGMVGYTLNGKKVNGKVVPQPRRDRREDGMVQLRAEPLLTQEKFDKLQAAVAARKQNPRKQYAVSPLSGSIYCPCGQRLYRKKSVYKATGKVYWYYACSSGHGANRARFFCGHRNVEAEWVEREARKMFLGAVGRVEVLERVVNRSGSEVDEMDQVKRAMRDLGEEQDLGLFDYPGGREQYLGRMRNLKGRLDELTAISEEPAVLWRSTGKTYGDLMTEAGDDATKMRDLYALAGVRIVAAVDLLNVEWPDNLAERMRKAPQPRTRAN